MTVTFELTDLTLVFKGPPHPWDKVLVVNKWLGETYWIDIEKLIEILDRVAAEKRL